MKGDSIVSIGWEPALPAEVEIIEVGPRDGFQIQPGFIPTEDKVGIIQSLIAAGVRRMEVTAFVHPKAVPQMQDAAEVVRGIEANGCQCFAMVPNLKGAQRAIESGISELNLVVSVSEAHNRSNVRMGVRESLDGFPPVIALAAQSGARVRASLATSFGCPFEGNVPVERVVEVGKILVDMGCVELNLCDTTGMANPRLVARVAGAVLSAFPHTKIAMHFHNTRGAGVANLLTGMQCGVRGFEASFGGLGGCPFAPGAWGNVCTEDVVHMLHEMGVRTGIDLDALLSAVRNAEKALGFSFPGQVIRAGRSCDLYPLPIF